jgi:NAD(P)-dependent dehydrogenase (short-subunit alcohol dehydrogenase family)
MVAHIEGQAAMANSDQSPVFAITGASGVLGSGVAVMAAVRGARLALIDQAPNPSAAIAGLIGENAIYLGGVDLTDAAEAKTAIDAAVSRFGRLDGLFNIAGAFRWTTVADSDAAGWDFLFRVNVQTAVNASRAATEALKASRRGRIVNVGAAGAERAGAGMGPYAASKAGVHKLTESLAEELKGIVTVNAVLPTTIDTPQNRADMPKSDPTKWVSPGELANVILFLASPEASAVTGALLRVNGRV